MTGSSDGVIKVFRNYESEKEIELVSAFRALTDLVPSNKNAGLVLDWQQGQGKLLVAGDVKVIRVWNAATEICTNVSSSSTFLYHINGYKDIPARSGSCITSLTSDQVAGNVFVGGYGDGAIRVFDQRLKPALAMVKVWREHKQWITNVHMQRGGLRELISGSRNGEVKLWDIRKDKPLHTIRATKDTLRTLSVHEHAPVFATCVPLPPLSSTPQTTITLIPFAPRQRLRTPQRQSLQRQRRLPQQRRALLQLPAQQPLHAHCGHGVPSPPHDAGVCGVGKYAC